MMDKAISEIQSANRFQDLSSRCFSYFEARGVCQFSYFHFPPIGAMDYDRVKVIAYLGYPDEWVRAYRAAGYVQNDPVVVRLLRENRPVWTKELLGASDASEQEKEYLDLLNGCGVKNDLAIPVFGPGGRNGGYGIGFLEEPAELTIEEINEMQWVCQSAHIKYCELLDQKFEKLPSLSNRETQVLKFVAHGQSNSQIASDLSVSSKTIETYLSRIFFKLDVHDRMTAALRAISHGMI